MLNETKKKAPLVVRIFMTVILFWPGTVLAVISFILLTVSRPYAISWRKDKA